jgi:CO/xanthine dehydrogenase FAD-binding subunit
MRAYVPSYQLISPASLGEALDALARDNGTWKPFAGGTDLMVLLEAGKLPHQNYVNIWNLKELRGIEVDDDFVTLGALTTIPRSRSIRSCALSFPCLPGREGNRRIADQNGTLGGNIVNASPAADSPPALLAAEGAEFSRLRAQNSIFKIPYRL